MPKLKTKLILDAFLTLMLIAEMFIQFTGVFLHEVIGAALFVSLAAHVVLERAWILRTVSKVAKGGMSRARMAKAVVAALLILSMVAMVVSSVIISTVLRGWGLNLTALNVGGVWTIVHTASAYVICALAVVHLAMHWALVAGFLRVPYNPERRAAIGTVANGVAAAGVVGLGVLAARSLKSTSDDLARAAEASSASTPSVGAPGPGGGKGKGRGGEVAPPSSGTSSFSGSSGICTLCHKACPLSAPRCDKPYSAGLI